MFVAKKNPRIADLMYLKKKNINFIVGRTLFFLRGLQRFIIEDKNLNLRRFNLKLIKKNQVCVKYIAMTTYLRMKVLVSWLKVALSVKYVCFVVWLPMVVL